MVKFADGAAVSKTKALEAGCRWRKKAAGKSVEVWLPCQVAGGPLQPARKRAQSRSFAMGERRVWMGIVVSHPTFPWNIRVGIVDTITSVASVPKFFLANRPGLSSLNRRDRQASV